jgi:hypothetical protein
MKRRIQRGLLVYNWRLGCFVMVIHDHGNQSILIGQNRFDNRPPTYDASEASLDAIYKDEDGFTARWVWADDGNTGKFTRCPWEHMHR